MTPKSQQPTAGNRQSRLLLALVLALFALLCFWFSMAVPPFETPDEPFHYAFARHISQGHGLPVQRADEPGPWAQEGSQAPLYYLLAGALISPIDQSDFADVAVRNRRANIGDPLFPGNKNFMLYSAAPPPLRQTNLALHVGRWFSLLLGALTLLCTYGTARLAAPDDPAFPLRATLFVAVIPQFLFIHASFTNDTLIIAVSAATVYWLAHLLVRSRARPVRMGEWLVLGGLLGLAALSKLQGLGLFVLAALVGLWIAWRRRDPWLPLRALLPVALPPLLIAGWWYGRNYLLYGDALGLSHLLEINGQRDDVLGLGSLWGELRGLRYSFWGLFGWFNIPLPRWMYGLFDVITILGVVGLVGQVARNMYQVPSAGADSDSRPTDHRPSSAVDVQLLLLLWALLSFGLLAYWISQATGSQGRLLFPAIGAIGILLTLGLDWLLRGAAGRSGRPRVYAWGWGTIVAFFLAASLFTLLVLFPRSYHAPAPVATVPASAQPVNITYGDDAQGQDRLTLLALEIEPGRYQPGEIVPVTLYLQADAPVRADYQLFIQFLDEAGREVANLTSHPGWGRNPTSLWQPGAIYADSYPVRIARPIGAESPLLARVYVGFVDPTTEESGRLPLRAFDADGVRVEPMPTSVVIRPRRPVAPDDLPLTAANSEFGDVIRLVGYEVPPRMASDGGTLPVTLLWEATGAPATDYVAYAHLLDEAGQRVTGFDRAPSIRFPTAHWRSGDRVVSHFSLELPPDLPPGSYAVWVGLYEADSGGAARLPVTAAGALETAHDQVRLGEITLADR